MLARLAVGATRGRAAGAAAARRARHAAAAPAAYPGEAGELAEFREGVRAFAQEVVAPLAAEIDRANSFPAHVDLWKAMGDLGLHGITVPERYGGLGLGYLHHAVALEELSRASGAVGLAYGAHSNLCVSQLARHGTPAQKAKYLPALVAGDAVGALAMSEPGAGSDVVSMRLRARKSADGSHYTLDGAKMWITNGTVADTLIVYAKTDPDPNAKPSRSITAFVVEKGTPGFAAAQKLDKLGMRGSDTCELTFEKCEVPAGNVLGAEGKGVGVLMSGLDYERLVLAAGPLGLMQAALDVAVPYAATRRQFGVPIGEHQLVGAKLADMWAATASCRAFLHATARAADAAGTADRAACAAVILVCAEAATKAALDAIQVLGGNGYVNEYPTGRLLRDAKLYEIGAGTSEVRRLLIGRELVRAAAGGGGGG